jgi:DNA-binding CsgD family transcriptional regulator
MIPTSEHSQVGDGGAPGTRELLRDAARDVPQGRSALVEPGSFMAAVLTSRGRVVWSDQDFAPIVDDVSRSVDCGRLIARSRVEGRATGLIATSDRGTLAVQASSAAQGVTWPLPAQARAAFREGAVLLVAFAPSRSSRWAREVTQTVGLAPREAELAIALLEAPSLKLAAALVGMSVASAKDALERACRRVGARNATELLSRLLDVTCGAEGDSAAVANSFGLTPAQVRVAAACSRGASVAETARGLGVPS